MTSPYLDRPRRSYAKVLAERVARMRRFIVQYEYGPHGKLDTLQIVEEPDGTPLQIERRAIKRARTELERMRLFDARILIITEVRE